MARISLAVYLMLLVALSTVYGTQGMFSVPSYLKNFPKQGKDFEPFAYKGMSDFMIDLEDKCPQTAEFKNFFVKLKDYMDSFSSTSPGSKDIQLELSIKSEELYRAMAAFNLTKAGTLEDSWRLVNGLVWMGKGLVDMKKSGPKEITFEQRKELIGSMMKWTRGIGLFVKKASENKGQSIDLSSFGIDYDTKVSSPSKRGLYETQGTFILPQYLKNLPKLGKDFEPFAYKGMLDFLNGLEAKCPRTTEFKDLFAKLEDYMSCYNSASSGSKDIMVEMSIKSENLFRAMYALDGIKTGTSVDSWRMVEGLLSMGKDLVEMKKHGSKEITFEQRKDLVGTMMKWARAIGIYVKTASEKKGHSIDLSSFGIDYDNHDLLLSKELAESCRKKTFAASTFLSPHM